MSKSPKKVQKNNVIGINSLKSTYTMLFGKKFKIAIAVTFGQVPAHFRFGGALVDRMALMIRKNYLFVWLVGILDCLLSLLVLVVMVVSIVDDVFFSSCSLLHPPPPSAPPPTPSPPTPTPPPLPSL